MSPERVGYVLQQIVDFLPSLDSSGLTSDAATALATARQALTSAQSATSTAQTAQTAATSAQNVANSASSTAAEASRLANAASTAVNELTRLQTAVLGLTETTYGTDSLTQGYKYQMTELVGQKYQRGMSEDEAFACLRIAVSPGDVVEVRTVGGNLAKAWLVCGENQYIKAIADSNVDTTENPALLAIEEEGYVYMNCKIESIASFSAVVRRDTKSAAMEAEIAALADDVAEVQGDISDMVMYGYDDLDHNEEDEEHGVIYALNVAVGKRVTNKISSVSTEWGCIKVKVDAGDTVSVRTVGSVGNYRAWVLGDRNGYAQVVADAVSSATTVNDTVPVVVDGYFYVNCKGEDFSLTVRQRIKDRVAALEDDNNPVARMHNNPLPLWQGTLKVLAIGNSYIKDCLAYLSSFISGATGLDATKLGIYGLVKGGGSPQTILNLYNSGAAVGHLVSRYAGDLSIDTPISAADSLAQVLNHEWDVVVLHQYSKWDYTQYDGTLVPLMQAVRSSCPNQRVVLAWHSIWGRRDGYGEWPSHDAHWEAMCAVSQEQVRRDGMDIVIPTGTAIENARNTGTFYQHNGLLTRDGSHACFGAGRYLTAATWFQSLISPMFGVGVVGNSAIHICTDYEHNWTPGGGSDDDGDGSTAYDCVDVDATNNVILQRCALAACVDMWSITDDIDPIPEPENVVNDEQ